MSHSDAALNHISLEYSYEELKQTTRNFDAAHQLGSGSFGGVFRGVQRDGTEVAIKVLEVPEEAGFEDEVRVLSKFRHPNLVILMGFARHGFKRYLVYELLAGGDVFKRLQKSTFENVPFLWRARVSAAFDAACGLSHLHNSTPKVFHRDIKSPNILLDRNGTAKMADFGLACVSQSMSQRVEQASGTVGYACPLYVQRGVVTEGSEVYSFGIVLLELLTASPPAYMQQAPDGSQQYNFLVTHINGDARIAASMADARAQWSPQILSAMSELALRCTQIPEEHRPLFTEVVNVLRTWRDAPDAPPMALVASLAAAAPNLQPGLAPQPMPQYAPQQVIQQPSPQPAPQPMPQPAPQVAAAIFAPQPSPAAPVRQVVSASGAAAASAVSRPRAPIAQPVLWTLDCVSAGGVSTQGLAKEVRSLVHRQDPGGGFLTTLRVGRLFQETFFAAMLADDDSRNAVSREHFQIWADEAPGVGGVSPARSGMSCYFFLTNFSANGTFVNGQHLVSRGEQVPLHEGDTIAMARMQTTTEGLTQVAFIKFRFDLTGSMLTDADQANACKDPRDPSPPPQAEAPAQAALAPGTAVQGPAAQRAVQGRSACSGTSFTGDDLQPAFLLEAGGSAIRQGVAPEHRCIVHGPPLRTGPDADLCPTLLLGRSQQSSFWHRLLIDEAFNAFSRQHFQIEAVIDGTGGSAGPATFQVRNLSDRNPIRLCATTEDGEIEAARPFAVEECWPLCHSDIIVVNPNRGNTLWFTFLDLAAGKSWTAARAAPALPPPVPLAQSGEEPYLLDCGGDGSEAPGHRTPMAAGAPTSVLTRHA